MTTRGLTAKDELHTLQYTALTDLHIGVVRLGVSLEGEVRLSVEMESVESRGELWLRQQRRALTISSCHPVCVCVCVRGISVMMHAYSHVYCDYNGEVSWYIGIREVFAGGGAGALCDMTQGV